MRAQMGLCLMKFGPSCTCHFRGISDQRPLHRLEHPSRNWRESRSQESVRLICDNGYFECIFRFRPIVKMHTRCNCVAVVTSGRAAQRGGKIRAKFVFSITQSRNWIKSLNKRCLKRFITLNITTLIIS